MAFAPHLRDAFAAADYRYADVAARLGPMAHAALSRNETTPGRRATSGGDRLDTMIRLWLLQVPVPVAAAERALPDLIDRLCVEGLLRRSIGEVAAAVDVRPYATDTRDLWVASDLTPGLDGAINRVSTDHVLGISSASTSLAQLTIRDRVADALDLGTGCGVQALHLGEHAARTVATDVNPRALWLTRLNVALNEVAGVEVRTGSFFEPVAHESFDLIVTNPPFVISPATGERLVYRDSGLPGDEVVQHVVRRAPRHLRPGGWCQVLANWAHVSGHSWEERVGGWVAGCDALIVQREVIDPAAYVELWLRDAGAESSPDYLHRYDTWLSWFDEQGIEGIGFGWLNLRSCPDRPGRVECLDWPHAVEQPVAPALAGWGTAREWSARTDDEGLQASRLVLRSDVRQEAYGAPGAEDPETLVLRQQAGLCRAETVDTVTAAVTGACDGELRVGEIADAVGRLVGDVDRVGLLAQLRSLVEQGFLLPE